MTTAPLSGLITAEQVHARGLKVTLVSVSGREVKHVIRAHTQEGWVEALVMGDDGNAKTYEDGEFETVKLYGSVEVFFEGFPSPAKAVPAYPENAIARLALHQRHFDKLQTLVNQLNAAVLEANKDRVGVEYDIITQTHINSGLEVPILSVACSTRSVLSNQP